MVIFNVSEYIGHGIQPTMHEEPAVPHYGVAGHGLSLKPGMTITIEQMVNMGGWKVETSEDDYDNVSKKIQDCFIISDSEISELPYTYEVIN